MAVSTEIQEYLRQVREATYGKDVREAIAKSLDACYGFTSGETAIAAADRANAAAATVEAVIGESQETLAELQRAVDNIDDIIKVSDTQPTENTNKLWVQSQDNTEIKIATYGAYEALWNQMQQISATYATGHGGITTFEEDTEYENLSNPLEHRYVINYSDGTSGEIFIYDGEQGAAGPVETVEGVKVFYQKQTTAEFNGTPPDDWVDDLSSLSLGPGDYLWTVSKVTFSQTGQQTYGYGLSRIGLNGLDGSGAVNSVAVGENGDPLVGNVKLPIDSVPTANSGNLITSGGVYSALSSVAGTVSPEFTGTPTAPTVEDLTDSSDKLATTAFVQSVIEEKTTSFKVVTLALSGTSLEYSSSTITENTVVIAALDIDYSKLGADITWATSSESLVLTTPIAPSEAITFRLVLSEAE